MGAADAADAAPEVPRGAPGGALARADGGASPARLFVARYHNPHSRRAMLSSLRAILRAAGEAPDRVLDFPWHALTFEGATALRAALLSHYKPRSTARHLVALAGVLQTAARVGLFDSARLHELTMKGGPLHPPRVTTAPAGRMLDPHEVIQALDAATSKRDAAIVALAAFTGLRRFEISGLDLADLDFDAAQLRVRHGKGDKERTAELPPAALARLEEWVSQRGQKAGPLFYRAARGGHLVRERLSPGGVYEVIIAACKSLRARATPHDFRRTFASTLFDNGTDLLTVRDMMGHANVETTSRYDRRGDARKRRAAAVLDEVFRAP